MPWIDPDPKGEVGERVGFNAGNVYSKTRPGTIIKVLKHTVHVRLDERPLGDAIIINKRTWRVKGEGREWRPGYIVNEAKMREHLVYEERVNRSRTARRELVQLTEEMREFMKYELSAESAASIRDLAQRIQERADMAVAELA